jgi:HemY protein
MRAALWLLALFAVAVATALFAGNNQSTLTLFWPPHRIDLSLNLVLMALVAAFVVLHLALRALSALFEMPVQARRWRAQQKERAAHTALLDALGHLLSGRFIRARKAAMAALAREKALDTAGERLSHAAQLRTIAHLVAAESAQALQDRASRDGHLQQALELTEGRSGAALQEIREGAQLRAARWALDERDVQASLGWLEALAGRCAAPHGGPAHPAEGRATGPADVDCAGDRTPAWPSIGPSLRAAAQSLVRGLMGDLIQGAHDLAQLQRVWDGLDASERLMPDIAIQAARRLLEVNGDGALACAWLLPVWEAAMEQPGALNDGQTGPSGADA